MLETTSPLTELHAHLYGCLRPTQVLQRLVQLDVGDDRVWQRYETAYLAAFGHPSTARSVVARAAAHDHSATTDFTELFVYGDRDAGDFAKFQAKFNLIVLGSAIGRAFVEHTETAYAAAAAEVAAIAQMVLDEDVRHDLAWSEQRVLLGPLATPALVERVIESILLTYRHHHSTSSTTTVPRLAWSLPREDPWPQWELVRRAALGPLGEYLAAIDFCAAEEGFPPSRLAGLLDEVRSFNARHPSRALAILVHVGESFADKSLESAVRWVQQTAEMGAHRLGHAIALGVDPAAYGEHVRFEPISERLAQIDDDLRRADELEKAGVRVDRAALDREATQLRALPSDTRIEHRYDLARLAEVRRRQDVAMERVRRTGAVIESCPTSNLRIAGLKNRLHHPLGRFVRAGLRVVVGADDPGLFHTTLGDELRLAQELADLSEPELATLQRTAWNSRSDVLSGRVQGPEPLHSRPSH